MQVQYSYINVYQTESIFIYQKSDSLLRTKCIFPSLCAVCVYVLVLDVSQQPVKLQVSITS